jgi:hypothetical protein
LYAYGWNDTEINQNLNALGAKFVETASRIHENRNQELTAWADAGRKAREQAQQTDGTVTLGKEPPAQSPKGLQPVDAVKLKEKYGEDELIDAITGPVNAAIEQINAILPQVTEGHKAVKEAEVNALMQAITTFFGSDPLKPYGEVYGTGERELTPEQVQHRNLVLESADALIAGAKLQGRNLTVQDAMLAAHDHVSSKFKETAVRTSLTKVAKERNRGLTLRPSKRSQPGPTGKVKTRSQLEKKIGTKLREVFG